MKDGTRKTEEFRAGIYTVSVYPSESERAPVVYLPDIAGGGEELLSSCRKLDSPSFHLVTMHITDWDRALSPWPARSPGITEAVAKDMGKAPFTMRIFEDSVIPEAEKLLGAGKVKRVLCGYSMAGLFAASAPFLSRSFESIVCCSAVLWYPGFPGYFLSHAFLKRPESAYFSLGDSESETGNAFFEKVTGEIAAECGKRGARSVFELSPGDHLTEPYTRLARGIAWTMDTENTGNGQ